MQQKTGQLGNLFSHAHLREGGHSAIRRRSFSIFAGGIVTNSSSVSITQPNTSNRESQLVVSVRITMPNCRDPVRPTIGSDRTRGTNARMHLRPLKTIGPLRGCHHPRSNVRKCIAGSAAPTLNTHTITGQRSSPAPSRWHNFYIGNHSGSLCRPFSLLKCSVIVSVFKCCRKQPPEIWTTPPTEL